MRFSTHIAFIALTVITLCLGCAGRTNDNTADNPGAESTNATGRVVIITTSHGKIGPSFYASAEPTGLWYEELAAPYYAFKEAGYEVDIVSIQGGRPPIDPRSVRGRGMTPDVLRFINDPAAQEKLNNTKPITAADPANYDAIYLAGGHGTMWDFPKNQPLQNLLRSAIESDQVVGAVCHGPAALINLQGSDRLPLIQDRKVNGFTNEEEEKVGLAEDVPFLLEDQLKATGARFIHGPAFEPFFVVDNNLFTGQNPASSGPMAKEMIRVLRDNR